MGAWIGGVGCCSGGGEATAICSCLLWLWHPPLPILLFLCGPSSLRRLNHTGPRHNPRHICTLLFNMASARGLSWLIRTRYNFRGGFVFVNPTVYWKAGIRLHLYLFKTCELSDTCRIKYLLPHCNVIKAVLLHKSVSDVEIIGKR